jgi:hypothetical protein
VLLLLALSRVALAQSANEAAAESLFQEGRRLLEDKKYAEACQKLASSYRLEAASGTLLGLAMCHEAQGKLATAWLEYKQVIARVGAEGRGDRQRAALERAQALEPRLATLAVSVPAEVGRIAGLAVTYDGEVVERAAWSTPFPVDPGKHVIQATAPARLPWRAEIVIGGGPEKRAVEVAAPEETPRRPPAVQVLGAESPAPPPRSSGSRVAAFALGGAGLAALGVGGALGIVAIQKNRESQSSGCRGDACTNPEARAARADAGRAADRATVALVAGGALLSGGALLYWLQASAPAPQRALKARIALCRNAVGAWVVGAF